MSARISQNVKYNIGYDFIRGLCALIVFFVHLKPLVYSAPITFSGISIYPFEFAAAIAVEFFFALSGVLLAPPLYKAFKSSLPKKNMTIFMLRRWYRTLPVYYLGLLFSLGVFVLIGNEIPDNILSYAFFVQNLFSFHEDFYSVSWSLSVEEIFYVIFPLLIFVSLMIFTQYDRAFKFSILTIFLICLALRSSSIFTMENWNEDLRVASLLRLDTIAVGVFFGLYVKSVSRPLFWLAIVFTLATYLYWSIFASYIDRSAIHACLLSFSFTLLPFACAVIVLKSGQILKLAKNQGLIKFNADISYSLYVFHIPLINLLIYFKEDLSPLFVSFFILSVIGFCYLIFRCIETPILLRRPNYVQ